MAEHRGFDRFLLSKQSRAVITARMNAVLLLASFFPVLPLFSPSLAAAQTVIAIAKPQTIYAPNGFDSNDNAQLVLAGVLSGYCMKVGATRHQVDSQNFRIHVRQEVSVTGNCSDLAMYLPYSTVVDLGPLPEGTYQVAAQDSTGQYTPMSQLRIARANGTSSAGVGSDARLYAPVRSIEFWGGSTHRAPVLTLKGVLTNTCLSLDEAKVIFSAPNIVEVLPLVRVKKQNCKASATEFGLPVHLPGFPAGETLIHVRSMNGQSLNRVITPLDRL